MRAIENHPRAVRKQIAEQPLDAETLLYDERRHAAFCLNTTAAAVWRLADGTRSVREICAAANAELGATIDVELIRFAIDQLRRNGLMETSAAQQQHQSATSIAATPSRAVSRRTMLRLGAGAAAMLPIIAAIVAPTAAQAYSGCVDCSVAGPRRARRGGSSASAPSDGLGK